MKLFRQNKCDDTQLRGQFFYQNVPVSTTGVYGTQRKENTDNICPPCAGRGHSIQFSVLTFSCVWWGLTWWPDMVCTVVFLCLHTAVALLLLSKQHFEVRRRKFIAPILSVVCWCKKEEVGPLWSKKNRESVRFQRKPFCAPKLMIVSNSTPRHVDSTYSSSSS